MSKERNLSILVRFFDQVYYLLNDTYAVPDLSPTAGLWRKELSGEVKSVETVVLDGEKAGLYKIEGDEPRWRSCHVVGEPGLKEGDKVYMRVSRKPKQVVENIHAHRMYWCKTLYNLRPARPRLTLVEKVGKKDVA